MPHRCSLQLLALALSRTLQRGQLLGARRNTTLLVQAAWAATWVPQPAAQPGYSMAGKCLLVPECLHPTPSAPRAGGGVKGAEDSDSLLDPGSCPLKSTASACLCAPPLQSSMWTGSPGPLSVLGCCRHRLSQRSHCGQRESRAGRGAGAGTLSPACCWLLLLRRWQSLSLRRSQPASPCLLVAQ